MSKERDDSKGRDDVERRLEEELTKAVKERGLDAERVKAGGLRVERQGASFYIMWGNTVAVSFPAPSQEAIDAWFKQHGAEIVRALVVLLAVLLGAGITIAAKRSD